MTTCLGKSCSFCLPRVPFVNCRQFMCLVVSLLVWREDVGSDCVGSWSLLIFLLSMMVLWPRQGNLRQVFRLFGLHISLFFIFPQQEMR